MTSFSRIFKLTFHISSHHSLEVLNSSVGFGNEEVHSMYMMGLVVEANFEYAWL